MMNGSSSSSSSNYTNKTDDQDENDEEDDLQLPALTTPRATVALEIIADHG